MPRREFLRRQATTSNNEPTKSNFQRHGKPVRIAVVALFAVAATVRSNQATRQLFPLIVPIETNSNDDQLGRNSEYLEPIILPGNHVNIPPPSTRIGPDGQVGYIHDPHFAKENPNPLTLSPTTCLPPGQGLEQVQGSRNLQRIRHHLETSTAPRNVTVFCAIYTHAGNVEKTNAIRETWGPRCDGLLLASSESNTTTGHMHLPSNSRHGFEYAGMHQRVRTILAYLYNHFLNSNYDYFHICGDDTYLIVEHLKEFLTSQRVQDWESQSTATTATGNTTSSSNQQYVFAGFWMHWGKMAEGSVYFGGGSGYTLSRKALKAYVEGPLQTCSQTHVDLPNEDMFFAQCLQEELPQPQPMLDTRDEALAHRYHQLDIAWHSTNEYPRYDGGFMGRVLRQTMDHMKRHYGYPILSKDDYISNSSIAFHRHSADDLRRYEVLLYRNGTQLCGPTFSSASATL